MNKTIRRFWGKVDVKDPLHCWKWKGQLNNHGYGRFSVNGKPMSAARWMFFYLHPEGDRKLCVCHQCDNPPCVNPFHLFLGTIKENVHDMIRKGRRNCPTPKGEAHPQAILKDEQVRYIRSLNLKRSETKAMAEKLGMSMSTVRMIRSGRTWRHLL